MSVGRVVVVAVVGALLGGCYTSTATLPGTLRADVTKDEVERVGQLDVELNHMYFLDGLIGNPPADRLAQPIQRAVQAKGADGVANIVYESKQTCGDAAWTGCTLGCVSPRTVRVTGDIVRIRAARLRGRPAKLVEDERVPDDRPRVAQRY